MKKFMKNVLTVCLTASLAVVAVGCSDKTSTSADKNSNQLPVETVSLGQVKQELTFNYNQGAVVEATEANKEDAVEDAPAETVMEEVTEMVSETNGQGQLETNNDGTVKMQAVVVETRPVVKTTLPTPNNTNAVTPNLPAETFPPKADNNNSNNNNSSTPDNQNNSTPDQNNSTPDAPVPSNAPAPTVSPVETPYTPVYDTCKAYWLDMTQMGDYNFNGEFLTITFQIKNETPDGNYPVTIATTDIASWDLSQYTPRIINGEVSVNGTPASQEDIPADEFTLKLNSVSGKQGDTVTMVMDLQNNPGFCGFVIDVQYDSNALSIVEAKGGKDFQKAITVNTGEGSGE